MLLLLARLNVILLCLNLPSRKGSSKEVEFVGAAEVIINVGVRVLGIPASAVPAEATVVTFVKVESLGCIFPSKQMPLPSCKSFLISIL